MSLAISTQELWLPTENLKILLIRKNIKNMYLRVRAPEGEVQLSAPRRASRQAVEDFIRRNLAWLREKRRLMLQNKSSAPRYVTGDLIPLWGQKYPLQLINRYQGGVRRDDDCIWLFAPDDSTAYYRENLIKAFYRRELMIAVEKRHSLCEERVGRQATEYRARDMKTRWGTCNIMTGRIWLNINLVKYPPRALDYVMIHELTHLWEKNHNGRFWQLVERACPKWREIRQELRNSP